MSEMYNQTHLFKRNSTCYFRAKIPVDLQHLLGKTEEKFSLKTKDPREVTHACQRLHGRVSGVWLERIIFYSILYQFITPDLTISSSIWALLSLPSAD